MSEVELDKDIATQEHFKNLYAAPWDFKLLAYLQEVKRLRQQLEVAEARADKAEAVIREAREQEPLGFIDETNIDDTGNLTLECLLFPESEAPYTTPLYANPPIPADNSEELKVKILTQAISSIEQSHFRTVHDHGASEHAQIVLGHLRGLIGLPMVFKRDLPAWDGTKYAMPENSNLIANAKPQSEVKPS